MFNENNTTTMFSQLSPVNEDAEPDASTSSRNPNVLASVGKFINIGAIGILSGITLLLFLQIQALAIKVKSEQQQIDELKQQIETSTSNIEQQVEKQHDLTIVHIAGTFTLLSCLVTMFHMTAHLRKMNQPFVQRKILAILWMSPIYGMTSFLSLVLPPSAEGYLGILKDFYESYVIYQFLSFLIAVLGRGDREAVVTALSRQTDHLDSPYKWLYCLFHPRPEESDKAMANAVLLECQVLAMQFVFFRPATAIVNFVLDLVNQEEDDNNANAWAFFYSPKFIILLVENVSVFFAFAGLLKFYHAVRDELKWCQPFAKFMTIKGVVFMTFWQGLIISIIFHANKDDNVNADNDDSTSSNSNTISSANTIQHMLICMEMLFFSVAHWCVFPAEEWEDGYKVRFSEGPGFGFKDFASDVNLIIDSGKKSMQARRREKKERNGLADNSSSVVDGLSERSSFESIDELKDEPLV